MTPPQSKSTPVDELALQDYTEMLADEILEAAREATTAHNSQYIDDNEVLLESNFGVADIQAKAWTNFPIIIRSAVNSEKIDNGPLIVSANAQIVDERCVVEIVIEGAYTWQKLNELREQLTEDLYTVLLHELTKAADYVYSDELQLNLPNESIYDAEYWNDPQELDFFLHEVTEEALVRAETFMRSNDRKNITRDQILDYVSNGSYWKQIENFMNERNHAKILKTAYTALIDAGWI